MSIIPGRQEIIDEYEARCKWMVECDIQKTQEIASLRAERDALKARVEASDNNAKLAAGIVEMQAQKLDAAQAREKALRDALCTYGKHLDYCKSLRDISVHIPHRGTCNCGLSFALKEGKCAALPQPAQVEKKPAKEAYYELIMAVGKKYPGETRHETALRYIREAENRSELSGEAAQEEKK